MEERDPELEARLKAAFKGCCFGGAIHGYAVCDSTMERAHALAREGVGEGTLVFASRQTQGRGRMGRKWESPEGGAYFSLILRPSRPLTETPQLSLVAGLATAEAIRELTGLSLSIRWPNDVLVDGKKVAGILTEASVQRTADSVQDYVVIGVGMNVSTDPRELPDTATSLRVALGSSYPLNAVRSTLDPMALAAALCTKLDGWYDIWTAQGFAPIREALRPWLNVGAIVRLTMGDSEVEGQATDIDDLGRLVVRLESGVVQAFEAGEVTLLR